MDGRLGAADVWERTRMERERTYMASNREAAGGFERDEADLQTGGYDQVAHAIMHAIANDVPAELVINVPNRSTIPELAADDVIEVPCRVDASGLTQLPGSPLPDHARGLVVNAKYVEHQTIEAATTGSRRSARRPCCSTHWSTPSPSLSRCCPTSNASSRTSGCREPTVNAAIQLNAPLSDERALRRGGVGATRGR